jgi:hypothetical protein
MCATDMNKLGSSPTLLRNKHLTRLMYCSDFIRNIFTSKIRISFAGRLKDQSLKELGRLPSQPCRRHRITMMVHGMEPSPLGDSFRQKRIATIFTLAYSVPLLIEPI